MTDELMHSCIKKFALERINLPRKRAEKYRNQVNHLSKLLKAKIEESQIFDLVKVVHAGSVAKGTALSDVNDVDIAVYIRVRKELKTDPNSLRWLARQLREIYLKMDQKQFRHQNHSVRAGFRDSPLDVDIVPVIYEGKEDYGWLVDRDTGERIYTNIPLHRKFVQSRADCYGPDYRQLIRIVKWWKRENKLKFKSFMIELLWRI
jgi:tRNA nucleotidyltransferase (CCA-adding enzyme)